MPLRHVLYRCPDCGHDPVAGEKDEATCPGCGTTFARPGRGSRVRVTRSHGGEEWAGLHALVDRIRAGGGALARARAEDGSLRYSADVTVRRSTGEEPAYLDGRVIGFFERMGSDTQGALTVTDDGLDLLTGTGERLSWPFDAVRALQTASASVQISLADGSVVQFEFLDDSPFRWEELLRFALRQWHREQGKGEILEFQPRIVTRMP